MALYSGDGFHQVYDIQGERLQYFNVEGWGWQQISYPAPPTARVSPQSVPTDYQLAFRELAQVYKSLQVSGSHAEFNFDEFGVGYVGANAIEAIESITLADALFQRLTNPNWAVRDAGLSRFLQLSASALTTALLAQLNLGSGFEYRVRIIFANGSSIIIKVSLSEGEIIRAETAEGQIIPMGDFSGGTWVGANLDSLGAYIERRFADHVERMGDSCPSQTITVIHCVTHRETGLHCTYTISCN